MECYYDVLEVKRDCSFEEIRAAYKRLARKWHPDKNPEQVELAAARFKLIQQAYEVLSDPDERAWYSHNTSTVSLSLFSHHFPQFFPRSLHSDYLSCFMFFFDLYLHFHSFTYKGTISIVKLFFVVKIPQPSNNRLEKRVC
jgi:DnaJ-class molecular chaperone